jgi:hypothetical protein
LPDIDYPFPDKVIVVTRCGRICRGNKKINFSQVFAGQAVGIKEVHDHIWLVSFMDYDLGYFDLETPGLEPLENPFGPKCYPCSRYILLPMSPGWTIKEWSALADDFRTFLLNPDIFELTLSAVWD